MEILNLHQGSPEWHAERLQCFTASEAPAMMGASKNMSRTKLLDLKKTGLAEDVSSYTQKIFDQGHETEANARPIIEAVIGEDLYPVTGKLVVDGLPLLASFDGLTMMHSIGFEHKQWNKDVVAKLDNGDIGPEHYWQLEQQLLVSGAEKVIFTVTDGTSVNIRHMEYIAVPGRRAQLLAGWQQFAIDLEAHEAADPETSTIVAEPVKDLPAVSVQVNGEINIIDNFSEFEEQLRLFVDERLITEPQTDQDFADLDGQIKVLEKAESALDAVEASMLSQVQTIDELKRTKDMLHKLARDNRLVAQKLLKSEKEKRRAEILNGGKEALTEHIKQINNTLGGKIVMPVITADFAGAMKNKRTIDSLRNAVDTTLANTKIEANQVADRIRLNLESLRTDAKGYESLFADAQQLVTKENDDLKNLITARINEHKQTEEKRLEDERERIREEERVRVENERIEREQKTPVAAKEQQESNDDQVVEPAEEVKQLVTEESPAVTQGNEYSANASGSEIILTIGNDLHPISIGEAKALVNDLDAAILIAKAVS